MNHPGKNQKGILAPFKNEDGSFAKWAVVLFIIALVFFAKDIAGLTGIYEENTEYEKEIKALMTELTEFGENILDENATLTDYTIQSQKYKYSGTRMMYEFMTSVYESEQKMEQEFLSIKEKNLDEIDLFELNDPRVIKEAISAYQQERKIINEGYQNDKKSMEKFMEKINKEHQENPDDKFVKGMYSSFTVDDPIALQLNKEASTSINDLYDELDNYLNFLLRNQGNYKYTKSGEISLNGSIEAEYDEIMEKLAESGEIVEEISAAYMNHLSGKIQDLTQLLE